jgi:hypothetical protein
MRGLLPLTLLLLAACGGGATPAEHTDAGYTALSAGDGAAALSSFRAALEAIGTDTGHAQYFRAKMGEMEALAEVTPTAARDEFLALAAELPEQVTDKDFSLIGGRLGGSGALEEAVVVLTAGVERYPESPHLKQLIDVLGDQATKTGASGALKSLQGLGYAGDD